MQRIAPLERQLESQKNRRSLTKLPIEKQRSTIKLAFSREDSAPLFLQEGYPNQNPLLADDDVQAKSCISHITDPLWQDICEDLLTTMGAASVLKIWESTLGEFSSQTKYIEIICKTEKAAAFVQQYDFVILGSLHRYFPTLKQLKVKWNNPDDRCIGTF